VQSLTPLTDDTWRVMLTVPTHTRAAFHAGQYLQLRMPDGSGRAFSIASAPEHSGHLELHIRAVPGHAAALDVIEHLHTREVVTVELPFGKGHLPATGRPLLLIAGGTGFVPMKALIESSIAHQESRAIYLYWGVSTVRSLYWHAPLQLLAAAHPRLCYVPVLSQADAGWTGATGYPHILAAATHPDMSGFEIFVSGSVGMTRAVYQDYRDRGVNDGQFHCDWIDLLREQGEL